MQELILPDGLTLVDSVAVAGCSRLRSISFPASTAELDTYAFGGCSSLRTVTFFGDAPTVSRRGAFLNNHPDFTIYHLPENTGFTGSDWDDHPVVAIDPDADPFGFWLVTEGFLHSTEPDETLDESGVAALMAYALNMDSHESLADQLPMPIVDDSSLSINFFAATPGIHYKVETSKDLKTWASTGVVLSDLREEETQTASISRSEPCRFLRLTVRRESE